MRRDRIRNETIQKNVEVTPLQNKIEKKKKIEIKMVCILLQPVLPGSTSIRNDTHY